MGGGGGAQEKKRCKETFKEQLDALWRILF